MAALSRVLIDWDFGAHGIWQILSAEELSAPMPPGRWGPAPPSVDRPRPWSDRLSTGLLDALQGWNETGEALFGGLARQTTDRDQAAFWNGAKELAARVQGELGPAYEVLYIVPEGAWRWVQSPSRRNARAS